MPKYKIITNLFITFLDPFIKDFRYATGHLRYEGRKNFTKNKMIMVSLFADNQEVL